MNVEETECLPECESMKYLHFTVVFVAVKWKNNSWNFVLWWIYYRCCCPRTCWKLSPLDCAIKEACKSEIDKSFYRVNCHPVLFFFVFLGGNVNWKISLHSLIVTHHVLISFSFLRSARTGNGLCSLLTCSTFLLCIYEIIRWLILIVCICIQCL